MKKLVIAFVVFGFASSVIAAEHAPVLDYGYVQISYSSLTLDVSGVEVDFDGLGLGGSFEIGQNNFITVGYSSLSGDVFGIDIDGKDKIIGLGGAWGISPRSDFVAGVSYIDSTVDIQGFQSLDDSGFGIDLGVRSLLTDSFELFGTLTYVKYDESDTGFTGGARFIVNESVSFLAAYQTADDVDGFSLGVRVAL